MREEVATAGSCGATESVESQLHKISARFSHDVNFACSSPLTSTHVAYFCNLIESPCRKIIAWTLPGALARFGFENPREI